MTTLDCNPRSDAISTWPVRLAVELVAPPTKSRRDLAEALAAAIGGAVEPFLHRDAEPSEVPGGGRMFQLTPAFQVRDASGADYARLVDDASLRAGLDPAAVGQHGWFRVVSEDPAVLDTLSSRVDVRAGPGMALGKASALFGGILDQVARDTWRLRDRHDRTLALALSLPGERERACRVMATPPEGQEQAALSLILATAAAHGFHAALESARTEVRDDISSAPAPSSPN